LHIARVIAPALLVALTAACSSTISTPGARPIPSSGPTANPGTAIKHIVILFQENRSFNSMFMDFPGAETSETGACKAFSPGESKTYCADNQPVKLHPILLESKCFHGCALGGDDIAHQYSTFITESDKDPGTGMLRMDGFDAINYGTTGGGVPAGLYPYGYVVRRETKPYWEMASSYTLADHMFSTEKSDSFPAHQEVIAGTTRLNDQESLVDSPSDIIWGCDAPPGTTTPIIFTNGKIKENGIFPCFTQYKTLADVLDAGNVPWHYYVESMGEDLSGENWNAFDAIKKVRYGPDWKNIVSPNTRVMTDAAAGTLPSVSWVIPKLHDSDHPASACPNGPRWVAKVVNAIGRSPEWKNTAIFITWDEWGGWYDGVPPPQLDYTTLGMRVPLIIVSPYAKRGYVSKTQYEFGSILKFVEQNFGTGSLGATDVRANSVGDVFDFTQKPAAFKPFTEPPAKNCKLVNNAELIEHEGGPPG
jgi:phospholipase C